MNSNYIINGGRRWLLLGILLLASLGSMACAQSETEPPARMQKADIAEIIDTLIAAFELHYVYPDTAKALGKHIRKRFADGAYDDIIAVAALIERLRKDMQSFTHDRHVYISVMSPDDSPPIGDTVSHAEIARKARENFQLRKVEWLTGNVGYLRLDVFEDAEFAGDAAAAAMGFLARCDAVIIDLRYNGGGEETMVRFLASYFFKRPTLLNALYFPETDSLEQSWTSVHVPGEKLVDADLYILTSKGTASGAEAFSYAMKNSGRAVLIGETTVGAAHWTESWEFPNLQIRVDIPIARPINPVTKTSWERTGVTPHIDIPSGDALTVAHREALKAILARTSEEDLRSDLAWELACVEAKADPVTIPPEKMPAYTGEFTGGKYAIFIKENNLFWRYSDGSEFVLIPLSEDLFGFDDSDDYRLLIVRDEKGVVSGFRLLVKGEKPGSIQQRTGDI